MRAIVISHIYTEKSGTSCYLFSTFAQIYHTVPVSMQYITCVLLTFYIYIHMLHSHQFQFNSNTIVSDTEFCFSAMSIFPCSLLRQCVEQFSSFECYYTFWGRKYIKLSAQKFLLVHSFGYFKSLIRFLFTCKHY